jgi:hypothetical protein
MPCGKPRCIPAVTACQSQKLNIELFAMLGDISIFWSKSTKVKLDISVVHHCTVHRAKIITEIGLFLAENEETWHGLHHTLASLTSLRFSSTLTLQTKERYISYNLRKDQPYSVMLRVAVFFAFLRRDSTYFLQTGSLAIEHKLG